MARVSETGTTRGSYIYTLRLPDDLRSQWSNYCEKNGKKAAETLRALMKFVIQDDIPPEVQQWIAEQVVDKVDDRPKERMEVRFTPSEYECLHNRAKAESCSPQRWVINCVRASLTHHPQFTMDTTRALWESSYQLKAIGRSLNQIAKNVTTTETATITQEQLQKLEQYIYQHTDTVDAVQNASLNRWLIKQSKTNRKSPSSTLRGSTRNPNAENNL